MGKITINILQEDIDTGIPSDVSRCPIAKAITRQYPDAELVVVSPAEGAVYIPDRYWLKIFRKSKAKIIRIAMPRVASKFIVNFDTFGSKDEWVVPFTFTAETVEREQ